MATHKEGPHLQTQIWAPSRSTFPGKFGVRKFLNSQAVSSPLETLQKLVFLAAPSKLFWEKYLSQGSKPWLLQLTMLYAAGDPRTYLGQKPLSILWDKGSEMKPIFFEGKHSLKDTVPDSHQKKNKWLFKKNNYACWSFGGSGVVLHANKIQKHLQTNRNPCTSCLPMTTASANGTELKTPRRWKRCELHWAGLEPNVKTAHLFTWICKQKVFTFWLSTPRPFLLKLRSLIFFQSKTV